MAFWRFRFRNRLFFNGLLTYARLGRRDRLSPMTEGDALAPLIRLTYSLTKRTVAQRDATKRPERGGSDGPFLRLRASP